MVALTILNNPTHHGNKDALEWQRGVHLGGNSKRDYCFDKDLAGVIVYEKKDKGGKNHDQKNC
jgi:hypothetical protein